MLRRSISLTAVSARRSLCKYVDVLVSPKNNMFNKIEDKIRKSYAQEGRDYSINEVGRGKKIYTIYSNELKKIVSPFPK